MEHAGIQELLSLLVLLVPAIALLTNVWYMQYDDSQRQVVLIRAISEEGTLPPKDPMIAGLTVIYPWGMHVLCAAVHILTGYPISKVFELFIIASFYLLCLGIYVYVRKKIKNPITGTMIAVYGCNFAWAFFFKDVLNILINHLAIRTVIPTFYFNHYTDNFFGSRINYMMAFFTIPQLNTIAIVFFILSLIISNKKVKGLVIAALMMMHPVFSAFAVLFSPTSVVAAILAMPYILVYISNLLFLGGKR